MQRWLLMMLVATTAVAGGVDFELVNKTGFALTRVWVAKNRTEAWQAAGAGVADGGTVKVTLANKADWHMFDLRVGYNNKEGKRRYEIFEVLELPTFKRVTLSVVSGDKWNAHYELK